MNNDKVPNDFIKKINKEKNFICYPKILVDIHKYSDVTRLLAFVSVIGSIILFTINLITTPSHLWSLICICSIIYLWIIIPIALKNNINITSKIMSHILFTIICEVSLDFIIGYSGWAVNFAIPTTIIISNIVMLSIVYINDKFYDNYFLYTIILTLLGLIPIILYFTKVIHVFYPTFVSTLFSITTFVITAIFYGDKIKEEILKRFHF